MNDKFNLSLRWSDKGGIVLWPDQFYMKDSWMRKKSNACCGKIPESRTIQMVDLLTCEKKCVEERRTSNEFQMVWRCTKQLIASMHWLHGPLQKSSSVWSSWSSPRAAATSSSSSSSSSSWNPAIIIGLLQLVRRQVGSIGRYHKSGINLGNEKNYGAFAETFLKSESLWGLTPLMALTKWKVMTGCLNVTTAVLAYFLTFLFGPCISSSSLAVEIAVKCCILILHIHVYIYHMYIYSKPS